MKAIEILSESKKIDEAPASTIGNIGRRLGAGVLGAMGLNTWAKGLNDKADIGTFSNRYYREFQSYLKSQGRTEEGATFADLKAFLDQNKIPSGRVPKDTSGAADAAMVNAILNRTATDFLKGTPNSGTSDAAPEAQPTATQQAAPVQTARPSAVAQPATAPVAAGASNIDSILKAVSRMKKADLQQLDAAVKAALTKPSRSKPAATVQQTPAQIRADKQRTAATAAQSQMAANPAPAKAPVVTPQDAIAQSRATKQAAAAQNAQAQMATNPAPGAKVWKNNRNPNARATSRPPKPKKAVAV
jgi:hypothetical protein